MNIFIEALKRDPYKTRLGSKGQFIKRPNHKREFLLGRVQVLYWLIVCLLLSLVISLNLETLYKLFL